MNEVTLDSIVEAQRTIGSLVRHTSLQYSPYLSKKYGANIWLKREDEQEIGAYKLRGSLNAMMNLNADDRGRVKIAASSGNHAQAFVWSCNHLGMDGIVVMPETTSEFKVERTRQIANGRVRVDLYGDKYDHSYARALELCEQVGGIFIHPFNDRHVISGQGTIGLEIHADMTVPIDYVFVPVGGGVLIAGIGTAFQSLSPATKIVGVQDMEAPAMHRSLEAGHIQTLTEYSHFVDGTAVGQVGDLTFAIARALNYRVELVSQGLCSYTLVDLHKQGIVAELAGALSVAGLENMRDEIKGKNIVCVLSGRNVDLGKLAQVNEKSLRYISILHDFEIVLPDRPLAFLEMLDRTQRALRYNIRTLTYEQGDQEAGAPLKFGVALKRREDHAKLLGFFTEMGLNYREL